MKKYFIKSTGEPLNFGDKIEVKLVKKIHGVPLYRKAECVFINDKDIIQSLIDTDIVGVREYHGKDTTATEPPMVDFESDASDTTDNTTSMEYLLEDFERLEKRVENMEKKHNDFMATIHKLISLLDTDTSLLKKIVEEKTEVKKPRK